MSCEENGLENANALFQRRLDCINTLLRVQEDIERTIEAGGNVDQVILKKKAYDQAWREFVCVHEQYLETVVKVNERNRASLT